MRARTGFLAVIGIVGLWVVFELSVTRPHPNARQSRAQLQCRSLAQTIEAYHEHPESGGRYPETLQQLLLPPFGGRSFLKNGSDDLIDPWGQQYQLRYVAGQNGTKQPLVWTKTNDGTPVSQYGAGPLSRVE